MVTTSINATIMPTSVSITKFIACLGIIVSSLSLAPVIYTHMTARDHSTLLPFLGTLQVWCEVELWNISIFLSNVAAASSPSLLSKTGWRSSLVNKEMVFA